MALAISVIHTADWQIGKAFANIPGDAGAMLREQRFQAIRRIAEVARDRAVDAVLVAGDVFDGNAIKDETIRRAMSAMEGFSGGVAARQPRRASGRESFGGVFPTICRSPPRPSRSCWRMAEW